MSRRRTQLTYAQRDNIHRLNALHGASFIAHVDDIGDIEAIDNELAKALVEMHERGELFDAMMVLTRSIPPELQIQPRDALREAIADEFRAEYRWQWRHEPDTAYNNLLILARLARLEHSADITVDIDGQSYPLRRVFDSVVTQMQSARANHEGWSRVDYAM